MQDCRSMLKQIELNQFDGLLYRLRAPPPEERAPPPEERAPELPREGGAEGLLYW